MSGRSRRTAARLGVLLALVLLSLLALLLALRWEPDSGSGPDPAPARESVRSEDVVPSDPVRPERVRVAVPPPAESEPARAPIVVEPTPEPRVTVTVRTEQGDVVPGALVRLRHDNPAYAFDLAWWKWFARTDARGVAELVAPMRGYYQVRATHEGRSCLPLPFELRSDQRFDVVIGPAVPVSGVVLRRDGTPVADARVTLVFGSESGHRVTLRGDTDDRGGFAVEGAREAMLDTLQASARTERAAIAHLSFARSELTFPVHLVLRATDVEVTGRVVDEQGEPLAGASVVPRTHDLPIAQRSVRTGATGEFTLALSTVDERSRAVISLAGRAAVVLPLADPDDDAGVVDLGDVMLRPGRQVSGRVVDGNGAPVEDMSVSLTPEGLVFPLVSGSTDADGRFSISDVGEGPYRADAPGSDWDVVRLPGAPDRTVVHGGDEDVRLVFRKPVSVRLSCRGVFTVAWLNSPEVAFLEPGTTRCVASRTLRGQRPADVRVFVLGGGTYDLRLTVPGFEPCVLRNVRIVPSEEVSLVAELTESSD